MPWAVILASGAILVVVFGIRHSFGLFLDPVDADLAVGRKELAWGIALQNLIWGLSQPFAGRLADRYGSAPVLMGGIMLYGGGLVWLGHAQTIADIQAGVILFCGLGLAGASFPIALAAVGKHVAADRRSSALGLASTGGSMGQFMMAPVCFWLLTSLGWREAFWVLAVGVIMIGLVALVIMKCQPVIVEKTALPDDEPRPSEKSRRVIRRGMILLCMGFFVCGFQVVFIMTHLPSFLADRALAPQVAAVALSLVGFFNIIGTLGAGWLGGRYRKSMLLCGVYGIRALAISGFVFITPLDDVAVYGLCIIIGLTWLATIPLTSGLTADFCRRKYLATAFGVVFLSHQTGAFLGAWVGGWWRERAEGYELIWLVAAGLGIMAALLHAAIPRAPTPVHSANPA